MEHCPRCRARRGELVELFISAHPRGRDKGPASNGHGLPSGQPRVEAGP
jgi:hypothetical protein